MNAINPSRRQRNYALYDRMRLAQNAGDRAVWLSCLSEDIVFEAPSYRRDGPIAIGLNAMSDLFDAMTRTFESLDYTVKQFIPALDPDLVLAEVIGDHRVASNGRRYRNDYLFLVQCSDSKITRIFEYSNPHVYSRAVNPT